MTADKILRFGDIDDVLGPAETRFLGGPYRAVRRRVRDVEIRTVGSGVVRLRATANIDSPAADARRSPHLDVIDVVLLTAETIECGLTHSLGLDPDERSRSHLRHLRLHPGRAPWYALDDIPIDLTMALGDQHGPPVAPTWVSGRVGTIRVAVRLTHPAGRLDTAPARLAYSTDLLGNGDPRYYADRFKWFDRTITDLEVDPLAQSVAASAIVVDDRPDVPPLGFGARRDGALSPVDALMVSAQLTKALLCVVDGIDPATDDVLLLRRLTATDEPSDHRPGVVQLRRIAHRPVEVRGTRAYLDEIRFRSPGITAAFSIVNRFAAH